MQAAMYISFLPAVFINIFISLVRIFCYVSVLPCFCLVYTGSFKVYGGTFWPKKNHRRAHAHNFNFITWARQLVGPHQHRIAQVRRDWLLQTATRNKRGSGGWEQQSRLFRT